MKKLFSALLIAGLLVASVVGCGTDAGGLQTIKIATQTPLSGSLATLGESIKDGAQMALEEHQAEFKKMGFDLKLDAMDDQADPKKGVANAQQLGADPSVLGVVGHLNSGVAIPSSEIYHNYHLVMVSPANTNPAVTDRGLPEVNRLCARDDFQGPAAAQFAANTLKAKSVFIIQDKTAYGQGLADAFKAEATKQGMNVVGYEGITVGDTDFSGVLDKVIAAKPDLLYYGGVYAEGGLIVKQARAKGFTNAILGGDGLDASGTVSIAGDAVKNLYYTTTVSGPNTTEGAAWAARYEKEFGKKPEGYAYYGYDSMNVLLEGLKNAINANGGKLPSRAQVATAVRAIQNFQGVATQVSFDDKGDNKFAKIYIFQFQTAVYPGTLIGTQSKN